MSASACTRSMPGFTSKNRNVCDVVMAAVVKDVNADGSNFLDELRTVAHMNEAGVKYLHVCFEYT